VVATPNDAPRFVPIDRPHLAIAGDGTVAAIAEATRVVVLAVPGAEPFAEVGVDPEALGNDVAWVNSGSQPRLLVLSRYATHSVVHLIDPHGPRTIAEIRLETAMKLYATVGSHALAIGGHGAAILTASDTHLTPFQFPARSMPVGAGAAGTNFIVALPGSIEEWDPQTRMPKRRLKLPRPAAITNLGGSDRVVWMTTQQEPSRLDVIALVNRGQPKAHDLPEPIAHAAGHPRSDLVVCIGAETGKVYVVDLDGRARLRTLDVADVTKADAAGLVVGRVIGALVAQAHKPVVVVTLDGKGVEPEPAPAPASTMIPELDRSRSAIPKSLADVDVDLGDDDEAIEGDDDAPPAEPAPVKPTPSPRSSAPSTPPPMKSTLTDEPPPAKPAMPSLFRPPGTPTPTAAEATKPNKPSAEKAASPAPTQDLAERFSVWRDKMRSAQPRASAASVPWIEARPSWREDVVAWTRAVLSGAVDRGAPHVPPVEAIAVRFDLAAPMLPALILLYGAHLVGDRGVAPYDIARVLGRRWDEALGRGQLAQLGLATFVDSRVRLAEPLRRLLDELPPGAGELVGEPGSIALLGPCVVVARDDAPLKMIAERCMSSVGGAILIADPDADASEVFVEARARGAAAMLRVDSDDIVELGTDPAILVVSDPTLADQLGIPRLS
jgi:hypothetical protein